MREYGGPRLEVDSAGTGDWHIGNPPHGPAVSAGLARGYDLSSLRARQFTVADFDAFDLILAMDRQNLADIEALRPSGNRTKVKLFLDYAPDVETREVPDPYYSGDFDTALDLIEIAARGLVDTLD